MSNAIEVEGLGKRYLLGERPNALASLFGRDRSEPLWALRDVDLTIGEGEAVGLIGRNGAGKSTLLKVIARITEPTTGVARMRGRVGALLEVGTGFHQELTGRENIYFNGAVLGMSQRDIRRRFDEIVEFAGIGRFLDTPLKRYSSGMYMRLAFSVAAHLEPDIVVVDEVLAVGDLEFQRKCLGRMSELEHEGRTVVFVSHDLGAIAGLCGRVIWVDGGEVQADGRTDEVLESYSKLVAGPPLSAEFPLERETAVQLLSATVTDADGRAMRSPRRDEPLTVTLRFVVRDPLDGIDVGLVVRDRRGVTVLDDAWSDTRADTMQSMKGEHTATVKLPPILSSGDYTLHGWLGSGGEVLSERELLTVRIWPTPAERQHQLDRKRILQPPVRWSVREQVGDAG